ncbi:MAG: hypothetical protein A3E25_13360 [Burkholderiales bacterium RIFCSPHIGHO2_12_FULL_69_20]|nr:MAG: hypothetical protein A3E25_13360 [Burkholderiales bacterium RIFCSPHIGHO2_12_FULL_69_20]
MPRPPCAASTGIDAHAFDLAISPQAAGDGGGPDDALRCPSAFDLTDTMLTLFHPCKPLASQQRPGKTSIETHHASR